MRRRSLIAGLLAAAIVGSARAQQPTKVYRIAIVVPATPVTDMTEMGGLRHWRVFFEELRRLGYAEGQNLVVSRYSGEGRTEHYSDLCREVVRSNPDLIWASTVPLVLDLKALTTTIPIVGLTSDPVANGIASSLSHPGGNITGVVSDAGGFDIWGKRLELLKESIPESSKVGFLATRWRWESPSESVLHDAAQRQGISLTGPPLDGTIQEPEYRRVFAAMVEAGVGALIVADDAENFANRQLIVALCKERRLPAIYPERDYVELGGLMAYAFDLSEMLRHGADQIDQILRGAKPGDIPFYQATKFELVINLKTAKALGLTVPSSLLAQADEVIE